MQTNITWKGIFYNSIENCILSETTAGNEITSTITGDHENRAYKVAYHIKTNKNWETIFVSLQVQLDNSTESFIFEKKEENWLLNNKPVEGAGNITDIDISLTPFTNTLPINRLQLKNNERQVIEVMFFDILEKEIKPVNRSIRKLDTTITFLKTMIKALRPT